MKLCQCFNAIYHKACNANSELVCVELMKSVCFPVFLSISPTAISGLILFATIMTVWCDVVLTWYTVYVYR